MFPTPKDILDNLRNVLGLFRRQEGSTLVFGTDTASLAKSFFPALFLFPVFFTQLLTAILAIDPGLNQIDIIVRGLILYSMYWTLFPVVVHMMGYRDTFRQFVVARNWFLVFSLLVSLIAGLGSVFAIVGMAVSLYLIVVKWFLIKDALSVDGFTAIKLYIVDAVVSVWRSRSSY